MLCLSLQIVKITRKSLVVRGPQVKEDSDLSKTMRRAASRRLAVTKYQMACSQMKALARLAL